MYTEIEQQTLDIDWFFTDNEKNIGFVASAGGKLPETIASLNKDNGLSTYFRSLPDISQVIINPELEVMLNKVDESYLSDFINMAKKGLYAFDKTILNNFLDDNYHLVASPKKPLKLENLSSDILDFLLNTKCHCNLRNVKQINISKMD